MSQRFLLIHDSTCAVRHSHAWLPRQETLASLLVGCLRRGGGAEACLAARALGLLLITLGPGPNSERHLEDARPALERAATASGRTEAARATAAEALAMATFVVAEDVQSTLAVMDSLSSWWLGGPVNFLAAQLACLVWKTFAAMCLPPARQAGHKLVNNHDVLMVTTGLICFLGPVYI